MIVHSAALSHDGLVYGTCTLCCMCICSNVWTHSCSGRLRVDVFCCTVCMHMCVCMYDCVCVSVNNLISNLIKNSVFGEPLYQYVHAVENSVLAVLLVAGVVFVGSCVRDLLYMYMYMTCTCMSPTITCTLGSTVDSTVLVLCVLFITKALYM